MAVLPAGDYTFKIDATIAPYIATIQAAQGTVKVMSIGVEDSGRSGKSALVLVRHGKRGTVRALRLAEAGRIYDYFVPKAERQVLAQAPELIQRLPVAMFGK